ncbi:MAG: hypothetical protein ACFNKJ_03255, partial [Rothia dentocariosa]
EIPFDESTMGGELHGDQYVDNAVSQKSPTKQMSVVTEPKIKNTVTLPEDQYVKVCGEVYLFLGGKRLPAYCKV